MTNISVIGIGSPHGADKIGWQAIEFLKKDHALQTLAGDIVKFLILDRPGIALLDYLSGVDYAIIIDAIEGGAAGVIVKVESEQLLNNTLNLSSHHAGIAEALALGGALNFLPKKIEIFGIETGENSSSYPSDLGTLKQLNKLVFDHTQSYLNL